MDLCEYCSSDGRNCPLPDECDTGGEWKDKHIMPKYRTLRGPFNIEGWVVQSQVHAYWEQGAYVVIYYHDDAGFAPSCNESERMWWFP